MVTIRQFQHINRIKSCNHTKLKEEMLIIAALNDMSEQEVSDLTIPEYNDLKKTLSYLDFNPPEKLIPTFEYKGTTYNVDTIFKVAGQFMDFSELSKDPVNNLHYILALFAYEGENYTHKVKERGDLFLDVDYRIAYSVSFFFSRFFRESLESIVTYSQVNQEGGMKRNGDGRPRWIQSAEATALNGNTISKWIAQHFLGT